MAYFRCGGGGIPSSLKTDMNAVLNKKFGTSTDYPPADWAPTVNLMGPLPEKTQASASVCSFDDGADDVPTKSLVVTIPPTLSGVSSVSETQTGRNVRQNVTDYSTAHDYEPYTTPTQYTANLGRTIYGGQADIVNGTGTDNGKKIKLNMLSWSYDDTSYSYGIFLIPSNVSDMTGNMKFVCTNYINNGHPRNQLLDGEIGVFNLANSNKRLVIRDDACTTLEQFLNKIADYDLVYESTTDTPFTFTGQEVPTRLGYNAFWSDEGDTEVTYRADIDLLLGGN